MISCCKTGSFRTFFIASATAGFLAFKRLTAPTFTEFSGRTTALKRSPLPASRISLARPKAPSAASRTIVTISLGDPPAPATSIKRALTAALMSSWRPSRALLNTGAP